MNKTALSVVSHSMKYNQSFLSSRHTPFFLSVSLGPSGTRPPHLFVVVVIIRILIVSRSFLLQRVRQLIFHALRFSPFRQHPFRQLRRHHAVTRVIPSAADGGRDAVSAVDAALRQLYAVRRRDPRPRPKPPLLAL